MNATPTSTSRSLHQQDISDAGFDALAGTLLGRREQHNGRLCVIADLRIAEVIEPVDDLAVAERVTFMLARRLQGTFAVVALPHTYLVVELEGSTTGSDAREYAQPGDAPKLMSIATPTALVPILADGFDHRHVSSHTTSRYRD